MFDNPQMPTCLNSRAQIYAAGNSHVLGVPSTAGVRSTGIRSGNRRYLSHTHTHAHTHVRTDTRGTLHPHIHTHVSLMVVPASCCI